MTKVVFGNHSSVIVPRQDRDSIRNFYCDVLGGTITKEENERDFLRLGENFFIGFLYGDVPDESEFLRTARSVWLEIKSDNVEEISRKILESGLARKLEVPDPHLYFQAPGGQCLRLVGIDEDMSFYEGAGAGPDVAKVKEAIKKEQMKKQDYQITITADVSAKEAFESIGRVSEWWTSNLEGSSQKLNDVFTVRFGETYVTFKIVDIISDRQIVWHVVDCNLHWIKNKKEWKDTETRFEISTKGKSTQIRFTHIGIVPGIECYKDCSKGWDHYVKESLLKLITEGKGLPEKK